MRLPSGRSAWVVTAVVLCVVSLPRIRGHVGTWRPSAPNMSKWELDRIADHLGVTMLTPPDRVIAWGGCDSAACQMDVRMDFTGSGLGECLAAAWMDESESASRSDAEAEFQWGPSAWMAPSAEQWCPLPISERDVTFHQNRQETGPLSSECWAIAKEHDGIVTVYFIATGNRSGTKQALCEVFAESYERKWIRTPGDR